MMDFAVLAVMGFTMSAFTIVVGWFTAKFRWVLVTAAVIGILTSLPIAAVTLFIGGLVVLSRKSVHKRDDIGQVRSGQGAAQPIPISMNTLPDIIDHTHAGGDNTAH